MRDLVFYTIVFSIFHFMAHGLHVFQYLHSPIVSIRAGNDLDKCREIIFHLRAEMNEVENEDKYLIKHHLTKPPTRKVTKSHILVGLGMEMDSWFSGCWRLEHSEAELIKSTKNYSGSQITFIRRLGQIKYTPIKYRWWRRRTNMVFNSWVK